MTKFFGGSRAFGIFFILMYVLSSGSFEHFSFRYVNQNLYDAKHKINKLGLSCAKLRPAWACYQLLLRLPTMRTDAEYYAFLYILS